MNIYVGITNNEWFTNLKLLQPDDVNFWQPGGNAHFNSLQPGEPFLFKLKSPNNAIAGVGFFAHNSLIPINIAWDTFQNRNGVNSFEELYDIISKNRRADNTLIQNPNIGCVVLSNPIFFEPEDWIPVPASWKTNIVQGKGFSMESGEGKILWEQVQKRILNGYRLKNDFNENQLVAESNASNLYKENVL
jgi:putative restriction endonuclease